MRLGTIYILGRLYFKNLTASTNDPSVPAGRGADLLS